MKKTKESKRIAEKYKKKWKKAFTKKYRKDIINKKYSPSKGKNIFHEREGLLMKETKDIILKAIVKELSKKYNKKEQMIQIMLEKCKNSNYNIKESKEIIEDFFKES